MKTQSSNLRAAEQLRETQPSFLYFFKYGAIGSYYFTNYDQDITISGASRFPNPQIFTRAQISHDQLEENTELGSRPVAVSLAATDTELRKYFLMAPATQIDLEIYRINSDALPGPISFADIYMDFKGVCQSVGFGGYTITAQFLPPILQEDRQVPGYFYQKTCNHQLYGPVCKVKQSLYSLQTTIAAIDRVTKTVEITDTSMNVDNPRRSVSITSEVFQGGVLDDGQGNLVGIIACEASAGAGTRLWLNWWPGTLAVSGSITISPGCLKIVRVCNTFFKNKANFGGTPYIPITNPATNSIIT